MSGNYLVEHSVGSVIRGAFQIYFRHFGTLVLIYVLPVVPVAVFQGEAQAAGQLGPFIFAVLLGIVVSLFAFGAMTVAVSDVCLGNPPSIRRSYARVLGKLVFLLLLTNLLQMLAILLAALPGWALIAWSETTANKLAAGLGFVVMLIPVFLAMLWFMLSSSIVVLENRSGMAALRRSKQLGDGAHWRNAGLLLVLFILTGVIGGVVGGIFGALFPDLLEHWTFRTLMTLVQQGLAMPITLIALVLIYYDRRVRKEGYDAKALAEDLTR